MKTNADQILENLKVLILERRKTICLCAVFFILLFSYFLRYYYIEKTIFVIHIRADAAEYVLSAANLFYRGIYSSIFPPIPHGDVVRFPGYPLFLIPFIALSNNVDSFCLNVLHFQAIISTMCIFLLYLIIRDVFPDWITMFIIFVAGFNPFLITMSGYLLSEILFTFLLLVFILTAIKAIEKPSFPRFALTGLILGLNLLVKPLLFPLPFLILASAIISRKIRLIVPVKYILASIVIMGIVFSPWSIYSYRTEGSILGSKTTALAQLALGTYPNLRYEGGRQDYPNYDDPSWGKWSVSTSSIFLHLWEETKLHPATYIYWYTIGKQLMLWQWEITEAMGNIFIYPIKDTPYFNNYLFITTNIISYILYYPIILGFLAYALMRIIRPSYLRKLGFRSYLHLDIIIVVVLCFAFSQALFGPFQRISIPFRILLYPPGITFIIYLSLFFKRKLD